MKCTLCGGKVEGFDENERLEISTKAISSAQPQPASPAPRKRNVWSVETVPVNGMPARRPANTTEAVP